MNDVKKIALQFSEGLDLVAFNSKDLIDKNNELLSFLLQVHGLENEIDNIDSMIFGKQPCFTKPFTKEILCLNM